MKHLFSSLAAAVILTGCDESAPLQSTFPDLSQANEKAMVLCSGCHGPTGIGINELNPNLACQKKSYLIKQLKEYQQGERNNHIPMVNIARMLSDEEIDSISEWYSRQHCPTF